MSPKLQEILQQLKRGSIPDTAELKKALQHYFPGASIYNYSVAPLNREETVIRCTLMGLIPSDKGEKRFCFVSKRLGQSTPIEHGHHAN